jgi:energy-coupling factor transport system ATP-binding protein
MPIAAHGDAALEFVDVSFAYPGEADPVVRHASASVPRGAFALLTGDTGSGKTTLLRLAKHEIVPVGELTGTIRVGGSDVSEMDAQESARAVGFVFQRPENQIVCDSVWHELAFGLENLAADRGVMRRRIAETCAYLGMEPWFRSGVDELSGGQRQILALASVLVMQPEVLLLDEPTSMLDPVSERRFLSLLFQLNRDMGVTVVVATHAPERMADYATMRLHLEDGRLFERAILDETTAREALPGGTRPKLGSQVLAMSDVWLRYDRMSDWVLRGMSLSVGQGSVHALVGNNGSGKSTVLSLMAGVLRQQRGRLSCALRGSQALLPQDPKMLLACQSVREELAEWAPHGKPQDWVERLIGKAGLQGDLLERHPYDLSGGQQQLVALLKLMAGGPQLLLMDEPTKGLDAPSREMVAHMVRDARDAGATVVVATHDLGFVRKVADEVSLLFDGQVAATEPVADYFERAWLW